MAFTAEQIRANALEIRRRINAASNGRAVTFLAACKAQPPDLLAQCAEFDFDVFGENRAQELVQNLAHGVYSSKPAHFIGHLQSRKVRDVVGRVGLIHSVDSEKLLALIDTQAQKLSIVQQVLLEVNIGAESTKSGVAPGELDALLRAARGFSAVRVCGLMAIPPICKGNDEKIRHFESLYKLFIDINQKKYDNVTMDILSMGMSGDFETAVRCGANLVRVGSALFGPRE